MGGSTSVLGASFAITAAAGTYEDTGLSIALPAAGTYLVVCDLRADLQFSAGAGAFVVAKLHNSTDSADVANSETMANYVGEVNEYSAKGASINVLVTVAGAKTIRLYAKRGSSGVTFTTSSIISNAGGRTRMSYVRVS